MMRFSLAGRSVGAGTAGALVGVAAGLLLLVAVGITLSTSANGSAAALVAVWLWLLPVLGISAFCGRVVALGIVRVWHRLGSR